MWFFLLLIAIQIYLWAIPEDRPRLRRMRERVTIELDLGILNKFLRRSHLRSLH